MKHLRKVMTLVVAALMALVVATPAWADGNTISVNGAQNGEKYNIYKMLDLSVGLDDESKPNSYRYTINTKWQGFWEGPGAAYIDTNTSGSDTYVAWKADKQTADDMEAFGKAAAKWAADHSIAADATEVTAANGKAEWTGLANGYYLVTSTYGTAASVASTPTNPVQEIREKNSANTTDKDVEEAKERNGTAASYGDSNDAAVGDTINFRAKVTIAKNSINVVYHDTMDAALDWTGETNVKVYTDEACTTELAAANYAVAAGTDPETFTVTFTNDYVASLTAATTDVYVKYSAVLNDNAVVATPVKNTGKVQWGEKGTSTETTTETNTHKFQILKYDGADAGKSPLANAKFQLFTAATGGTALKLAKNADGTIYRVVDTSDNGATLPEGYTLVSDNKIVTLDSGNITIEGVDSDDYYLEETDAPVGFNKLEGRTKVQVEENNNLVSEIVNNQGNTLPSTGGMGTTILYVVGGVMVAGAAVYLLTKKRASSMQ